LNLNLPHRINRELHGSVPVDAFRHLVRWNDAQTRIEMHLQAVRDIHFEINGQRFSIASGETIHTENSLKYGSREASVLLRAGGWTPIKDWTDDQGMFSVILAEQGSRGFDTLTIRNEASTPT
jgi:L-histidine N-alpha-methyltransferase